MDVTIIGAGPVGLVAAALLGQRGYRCRVIERASGVERQLRASTFHPPTLEKLEDLGVTDSLVEQGIETPTWQIRFHETNEFVEFDLGVIANDTRYPFRLQCEQWRLSEALVAKIETMDNVSIEWGTDFEECTQNAEGVEAVVRRGSETRRYQSRYLIGADGGRSRVREGEKIGFEGGTYPEQTILATTLFPFDQYLPGLSGVNYIWHRAGTFSLLRLPGLWRASLYPDEGESMEDALKPSSIETKLQRIVPQPDAYEVMEFRPYRIHQKVADTYRSGRVLLAGDAAHLNSPSGGMGMNGGIHDAFSLTNALHAALSKGDESGFDKYSEARRKIASDQILRQAHANRSRMQQRDQDARRKSFDDLLATAADEAKHRSFLLKSSMITGLREAQQLGAP